MKYEINPFLISNYSDMSVVQNSVNMVVLKDKGMIDFFNWCDKNAEYDIEVKDIEKFMKDNSENAIDFLLKNGLIKIPKVKTFEFNQVNIISNDKVFLDSIKFNSKGMDQKFKFEEIDMDSKFEVKDKDNLYILFMNPFNYKKYCEIVKEIKDKNVISRIGFYYNQNIFVTNYYKEEWKVPCPICFFGNLESSLRGKAQAKNAVAFQTILDLIYKKEPQFNVENIFTNNMILPFTTAILDEIDITDNVVINNVKHIDFNRNVIMNDQAMHWEMCDCYE